MTRMGVADTAFYRLYTHVRDAGTTYITGPTSLSPPFHTTRGIKQGCPLSPALFTLLLSGMHRYLELHTSPTDVPSTPVATFPAFSYTDNIVLLAHTTSALAHSHALVASFCTALGLTVSPTQYEAICIGPGTPTIPLPHHTVTCSSAMRILGVRVASDGTLARWCKDPDAPLHRLHRALASTGLLHNPRAYLRAAHLSVIPSILSGAEIWALPHLHACLHHRCNPYKHPAMAPLLRFLKAAVGLPKHAFNATVYLLYGLPTLYAMALPRTARFLATIPPTLHAAITTVAAQGGTWCSAWTSTARTLSTHTPAHHIDSTLHAHWTRQHPHGRHH